VFLLCILVVIDRLLARDMLIWCSFICTLKLSYNGLLGTTLKGSLYPKSAKPKLDTEGLPVFMFIRSFVIAGRGPAYSGPQC